MCFGVGVEGDRRGLLNGVEDKSDVNVSEGDLSRQTPGKVPSHVVMCDVCDTDRKSVV